MDQNLSPREAEIRQIILSRDPVALDQLTDIESQGLALMVSDMEEDELRLLKAQLQLLKWLFETRTPVSLTDRSRRQEALRQYDSAFAAARRLNTACWLAGRTMTMRTSENDPLGFLLDALTFLEETLP